MCKKMIFLMSFVLVLSLASNVQAFFDTWTAKDEDRFWVRVAMSAEGTTRAAGVRDGQIYVSTDSGDTWTAKDENRSWGYIAISADGAILAACADDIYVSTDSGNTWTAKGPIVAPASYSGIAMSPDGTILIAAVYGGQIYVSTDSGNTWTVTGSPSANWTGVAMSSDGTIQTAGVWGGQIYVSTDSGNTWTAKASDRSWSSVAMSADGTIQTASVDAGDGKIYVSTDSGNNWTAKEEGGGCWKSVAMSADGRIQTACGYDRHIYASTDSGNTWTNTGLHNNWYGIAMSADGSLHTAVARHQRIYVCSEDPVLVGLNPIPSNGSVIPLDTFNNKLQWTLPEPNSPGPGDVVLCDVHFGTNSSVWDNPKVVDGEAVEEVTITVTGDTYYWAVAIYVPGEDPVLSETFEFTIILNVAPRVNAGDDVDSWLVDELPIPVDAERVVQLNGIVTDDGNMQPLTYLWTVVYEPDPGSNPVVIDPNNIVNPTITMTVPGLYNLELEADDGEFTVSDTMAIQLYDTSCAHARNQAGFAWLAGDNNRDCKVNLLDIGEIALTWLEENYSTE